MKIALVIPEASKETLVYGAVFRLEPLGLLYLSSRLKTEGHETIVVDQLLQNLTDKEMLDTVEHFRPDLVGISVTYANYRASLQLAVQVKKNPDTIVVVGGCYPTPHPDIVQNPGIDLAVLGEGEDTMSEIVRLRAASQPLQGLAGTAWMETGHVVTGPARPRIENLDTIPFPDRRYSDPEKIEVRFFFPVWKKNSRPVTMVTSRGCGHRCGYCFSPIMWGGKWIGRSPENVVQEIIELKRSHQIRQVFFQDEEINYDSDRAMKMYQLMTEENLDITWGGETTVRATSLELAEQMVKSGLRSLYLGYESGAPEILDKLAKKYDLNDALKLTHYLQKRGVFTSGNFMLGLPWESQDTLAQTREFAKKLNLDSCTVTYHRPQPGTPFSNLSIREGLFDPLNYDETDYDPFHPPSRTFHLSQKEVGQAVPRFMLSFYGRPLYWMRIFFRSLRQPERFVSHAQFINIVLENGLRNFWKKVRNRLALL